MKTKTFAIALLLLASIAFAVDSPQTVLEKYYAADKNEDISALMGLTDFSHVEQSQRQQFMNDTKSSLTALARIFDTKSYELTNIQVVEKNDDAIAYYHVNSTLGDEKGKTALIDLDFVAVMHKTNGEWKIVYVLPKESYTRNKMIRELTVGVGNSVEEEVLVNSQLEQDFLSGKGVITTPKPSTGAITPTPSGQTIVDGCAVSKQRNERTSGGFLENFKKAFEKLLDAFSNNQKLSRVFQAAGIT